MVPSIRYAKSSDGIGIAYWVLGNGRPLIYLPPFPGHVHLDWQRREFRWLYEWLSARHQLIRIDPRNTGLSDRGVGNLSIEGRQLDVEAVADRLGLDEVALIGHGGAGSTAIGYAACHPERVRQLILLDATVGFPGVTEPPAVQTLRALVMVDWGTYTATLASSMSGGATGAASRELAALIRTSQTPEDARRSMTHLVFASRLLPFVSAPTLVVHHNDAVVTTINNGIRLARGIGDARLVPLETGPIISSQRDPLVMAAVDEFLAEKAGGASSHVDRASLSNPLGEERGPAHQWHVFISHASEDKDAVARPLHWRLVERGVTVWLDENEIALGDSLREKIDEGLANSRYAVVILSKAFFAKEWATRELNGLLALETQGRKVLLPIWHEIDQVDVRKFSPILADRRAIPTNSGLDAVIDEIVRVVASGDAPYRSK